MKKKTYTSVEKSIENLSEIEPTTLRWDQYNTVEVQSQYRTQPPTQPVNKYVLFIHERMKHPISYFMFKEVIASCFHVSNKALMWLQYTIRSSSESVISSPVSSEGKYALFFLPISYL